MGFFRWIVRFFSPQETQPHSPPVETAPTPPISAPLAPKPEEPLWLQIARREYGQAELRGAENPRIILYHSVTTLKAKEDEVPWCSAFACYCMEDAEIISPRSARARDWLNWGKKPLFMRPGAVVILSRGVDSGHVGFFLRNEGSKVVLLGGNQGDKVCEMAFEKASILGVRWPKNEPEDDSIRTFDEGFSGERLDYLIRKLTTRLISLDMMPLAGSVPQDKARMLATILRAVSWMHGEGRYNPYARSVLGESALYEGLLPVSLEDVARVSHFINVKEDSLRPHGDKSRTIFDPIKNIDAFIHILDSLPGNNLEVILSAKYSFAQRSDARYKDFLAAVKQSKKEMGLL